MLRAALAEKDMALAEASRERGALTSELAALRERMTQTAAEREALARMAAATDQGLDEAKARAAALNKAYEALVKDQKQRAAMDWTPSAAPISSARRKRSKKRRAMSRA